MLEFAASLAAVAIFFAFMTGNSVNDKEYAKASWFALCSIIAAVYGAAML